MSGYSGNGDRRSGADRRRPRPLVPPGRQADLRTRARRLMQPGIGIKRWLLVVFIGELLIAVAGAIVLRAFVRESGAQGGASNTIIDVLTLQFVPFELRVGGLAVIGIVLLSYGWWRLLRVLIEPYQIRDEPLVEMLYQRRLRARGPNVVAIGGGTGLSMLLRGLKELTSNITAVVTVADDGGSSGKLRTRLGVPPMGDIRNCIEALADVEPVMTRLLHYRFMPTTPGAGEDGKPEETTPFVGHAFGNLLIAALTDINGDFEEAVRQANRVLAVRGNVVPVAGKPITLHAELEDGSTMEGQSGIARAVGIRRVWISPGDVHAAAEALAAIAAADLVVIGPGSLYTSLLPPLLVPGIREALDETPAPRLFVCNVATQVGETEGYPLSAHLAALDAHGVGELIDAVLVNGNFRARQPANYPAAPVRVDVALSDRRGPALFTRDVVDDGNAHHHDSRKLATTIFELYDERVIRRRQRVPAR
jgi:uncharacterized cofD-like protein